MDTFPERFQIQTSTMLVQNRRNYTTFNVHL